MFYENDKTFLWSYWPPGSPRPPGPTLPPGNHLIHMDHLGNPDHSYLPYHLTTLTLTTCLELDWNDNLQKRILDRQFAKFEKVSQWWFAKTLYGTTVCQNILWNHNLPKKILRNNDLQKLKKVIWTNICKKWSIATICNQIIRNNNLLGKAIGKI